MQSAKSRKQSPGIQILSTLASDPYIVIIVALVLLVVYAIDTFTPLGEPVWLIYFIPLILSFWSSRYYAIPTVCIVTLLFLFAGFILSPQGIPVSQALLNRFVFSLFFFCFSAVLWTIRRPQILDEML